MGVPLSDRFLLRHTDDGVGIGVLGGRRRQHHRARLSEREISVASPARRGSSVYRWYDLYGRRPPVSPVAGREHTDGVCTTVVGGVTQSEAVDRGSPESEDASQRPSTPMSAVRRVCAVCLLCFFAALPFALSQDGPAQAIRVNNLGVAYLNQGRITEALDSFRQALQRNPSLFAARLNEGIALIHVQRLAEGRDALLDATRQQPQNARAWYNLGLAYRTLGDSDSAIDAFEHVAQIDPNDADTLYFLGQLHSQAGRHDQAIAMFVRCLALDSRHVSAEFGLARAYQRSGNAAAAARHLARFEELSQSKLGKPISSVYGEQGPYSTAEPIAGDDPAPSDFAVRFTLDTRTGIEFDPQRQPASNRILPLLGAGACFTDF